MPQNFQPHCLPLLIGSLPLGDHREAANLVFEYTPQIPSWVQLPIYKEERMIVQFLPGMPGLTFRDDEHPYINAGSDNFSAELFMFYEEYMAVTNGTVPLNDSRFVLKPDTAMGFFMLLERIGEMSRFPTALKCQITGPITLMTGVKDQNDRAIFYDEQLRDAALKLLSLKALWQVRKLKKFGCPVIIFFDEPALAGFGSSEFISISREDVLACFKEVMEPVRSEGAFAGVHVCSNTDWSLIFDSPADIVNFDAYAYSERFLLYGDPIKQFMKHGKMIAWGIVPTLRAEDIEKETADSLIVRWKEHAGKLEAAGIDGTVLKKQSLITPSCGMGSLSYDHTTKVLNLTKAVSDNMRK